MKTFYSLEGKGSNYNKNIIIYYYNKKQTKKQGAIHYCKACSFCVKMGIKEDLFLCALKKVSGRIHKKCMESVKGRKICVCVYLLILDDF